MDKARRENVTRGNPRTATTYSQGTQRLLKVMMEESKLNSLLQLHLTKTIKNGDSLPITCVLRDEKPKHREKVTISRQPHIQRPTYRTKEQIVQSGAYERDPYIPERYLASSAKEKERLQNLMTYGQDSIPQSAPKPVIEPQLGNDRFEELEEEIKERREFLEDMQHLGQRSKYSAAINAEISMKIREMEVLDKKRTAELKEAINIKSRPNNPRPESSTLANPHDPS
ncbi:PREDICTED: UPF0193 protein EVG1-like isoform X1 [Priapulus caudatus]|uniref:UPF0193 protein EVG1-like isoform X1 n=1 Tax=Priapulus caudatus TaxID=37621 RepID=A0ABM1E2N8_PRICU|nr:PREDICTED: UPF0193 protein EVG1-like isoform X1 [Priapulus caudatus]